jgi:hypothetical protein
MSHTPGPWVVEDSRKLKSKKLRQELLMVVARDGGMPGLIVNSGTVTKTDEANARLIAAAPDLLDALEEIVARFDDDNIKRTVDAIQSSRAAIKKAKGEL